jgi:hypothetical protein
MTFSDHGPAETFDPLSSNSGGSFLDLKSLVDDSKCKNGTAIRSDRARTSRYKVCPTNYAGLLITPPITQYGCKAEFRRSSEVFVVGHFDMRSLWPPF